MILGVAAEVTSHVFGVGAHYCLCHIWMSATFAADSVGGDGLASEGEGHGYCDEEFHFCFWSGELAGGRGKQRGLALPVVG